MKMMIKPMLFTFVFTCMTFFMSCNNEELFTELNNETVVEPENPSEDIDSAIDVNTPCDFDLNNLQPNQTIIINCVMDLGGATINIPSSVTIVYEGGDIINGTLNFLNDATISGELLNGTLTLTGSNPMMKDPAFYFSPKRWGIVEGKVSDAVALKNRDILQKVIDETTLMGINTFSIQKMDAYFMVGGNFSLGSQVLENGIHLPSNFNLRMGPDTFLRVQPNKWPKGVLLGINMENNITITGGNLVGDRYTHDYSPIKDEFGISRNSHEYPSLMIVAGGHDITVDNVKMSNSTGDGFIYASGTNRQYTPAIYCKNVVVKNCEISNSRRNNVTFGDGEYLTLENCKITNAGGGTPVYDSNGARIYDSSGVAPQFGVDIEAHRELDSNGNYVDYQIVEHIVIRGNTFVGNYAGDIVVFTANDVLIENNTCDNTIGGILFYNTIIRNNTMVQNPNGVKTSVGIGWNSVVRNGEHKTKNIQVYGNSITGFNTGMSPGGQNIEVKNNIVKDFKEAIYIKDLVDSEISSNSYESNRSISYGYLSFNGNSKNLVIKNDKIKVGHRPLNLNSFNLDAGTNLTIENCEFNSAKELYLEKSNNATIRNNALLNNKKITQISCNNIITLNNQ